jgi:hypothetical protein
LALNGSFGIFPLDLWKLIISQYLYYESISAIMAVHPRFRSEALGRVWEDIFRDIKPPAAINITKLVAALLEVKAHPSNISVQLLIDLGLFEHVCNLPKTLVPFLTRHLFWVISIGVAYSNSDQLSKIADVKLLRHLSDLLHHADPDIVLRTLELLEKILKRGERPQSDPHGNVFRLIIEEVSGLDKIENLQMHQSDVIYKKAFHILEKYFEDPEQDNALAPLAFQFGGAAGGNPAYVFL